MQAYIEYDRIVGNADGGVMMSEAEFEAYKNKVREARKHRLYTNWRNMETGNDCKSIGPASQCFCGHRFKDHFFDNVDSKQVYCRSTRDKCKCKMFFYIPICKSSHQSEHSLVGSQDLKCLCKHSCHEHDPNSKKCGRQACKCAHFTSVHACSCGAAFDIHETMFERREEREA